MVTQSSSLLYSIRTLSAEHADAYNAFFAAAVAAHPDTLRIAAADIEAAPFSTAAAPDSATLLAEAEDGTWLGVVTVERERGREKRRHIAWVLRMAVSAAFAGRGVGRTLLRAAVARASSMPGVDKINLTVAAHNERAVYLYQTEGFTVFSREPDAFRDPVPREELTMTLVLRRS